MPVEILSLNNLKYLDLHDNKVRLPNQFIRERGFGPKVRFWSDVVFMGEIKSNCGYSFVWFSKSSIAQKCLFNRSNNRCYILSSRVNSDTPFWEGECRGNTKVDKLNVYVLFISINDYEGCPLNNMNILLHLRVALERLWST